MIEEQSQPEKQKPRGYTAYWIVIFALTIVIGISLILFAQTDVGFGIASLAIILLFEYAAYYGRVKPSLTLNRIMYILIGVPLGFVIWIAFWMLIMRQVYPQGGKSLSVVVLSIIGCYAVAFLIGDLIGRLRHYKGPEQYQV